MEIGSQRKGRSVVLAVLAVSLVGALAAGVSARQVAGIVSGQVIDAAAMRGLADVAVTFVGPMEGQAERALASFPLMAEEIAERLDIPRIHIVTDAEGTFRFSAAPPGLYALVFRRNGYLGPAKPGDSLTSPLVTATVRVVEGTPPTPLIVRMIPRSSASN